MSKKKRNKNRATNTTLKNKVRSLKEAKSVCPNCSMVGEYHWVSMPTSLEGFINKVSNGFWICPKMYGPDGKRIDTVTDNPMSFMGRRLM